ncbi:hypothetical protein dsx2_3247 [Desulfovibrio sp. X2]|uniref:hypothetical protein n=1 Tax=Desulfovibrio sp. X2 TaxID=941449 RepID=UPI000358DBA6|nr:hypothetical protein [Desulfovibrio sp. X2]EPR41078.1 hypothetical protein dsx2_3247 [Desulfovibrio sp. X2]
MTLATTLSREQYATNGQTTVWPVPFTFYDPADIVVVLSDPDGGNPRTLAQDTDYTVGGGDGQNGSVLCPPSGPALPAGSLLTVYRDLVLVQDLDLVNLDGFDADLVERQLDRSRMIDQQLQEQLDRCLKSPVTDPDALTFETVQAERAATAAAAAEARTALGEAEAARNEAVAARDAAEGFAATIDTTGFAPKGHAHEIADVDGLSEALDDAVKIDTPVVLQAGYESQEYFFGTMSGAIAPSLEEWRASDIFVLTLGAASTLNLTSVPNGCVKLIRLNPAGFALSFSGATKINGSVPATTAYQLVSVVKISGYVMVYVDSF